MSESEKGKLALIGEAYIEKLSEPLKALGFVALPVPGNPNVSPALRYHADLSFCVCGENRVVAAKHLSGTQIVNELTNRGVEVFFAAGNQRDGYPWEVSLCALYMGGMLIHNLKNTDRAVIDAVADGTELLHVNQGYTKCAVCSVDDKAVITSDKGIHNAIMRSGLRSLLISPGYINLTGYNTGFIGGAGGGLRGGYVALTGRLDGHPDKANIEGFIMNCGLKPHYLTDEPIFDIGSIITV